jgi:hypothetical protein
MASTGHIGVPTLLLRAEWLSSFPDRQKTNRIFSSGHLYTGKATTSPVASSL